MSKKDTAVAGPELIVAELAKTRKYRHLSEETLFRIARWALQRYPKPKEAVKAAKRKLHQVFGLYILEHDIDALTKELLSVDPQSASFRDACLNVLRAHMSTQERVPYLEAIYDLIEKKIGRPKTLVDLACGLNSFTLPWMGIDKECWYEAWDIDHRIIDACNAFLVHWGQKGAAYCRDALVSLPDRHVDCVFLFKTLPCLEQQDEGVTSHLLNNLDAGCLVVSYPVKSVGGFEKGMANNYRNFMRNCLCTSRRSFEEVMVGNELFFFIYASD